MPIPAVRIIEPERIRNFGRFGDAVEVPRLTDCRPAPTIASSNSMCRSEKRTPTGLEGVLARNLPDRELRQEPQPPVHQLRAGQAALRPRRVPPAAPDLWPALPRLAAPQQGTAGRGRSLPRRHADHDRRRRVHHQRRRARRRQPAPPLARRRFRRRDRGQRTQAALLPHHSRARQLDRDQRHQEGHARRPHRPVAASSRP